MLFGHVLDLNENAKSVVSATKVMYLHQDAVRRNRYIGISTHVSQARPKEVSALGISRLTAKGFIPLFSFQNQTAATHTYVSVEANDEHNKCSTRSL